MPKSASVPALLLLAGCATLPAAPLDPSDPLAPALARAELTLRRLAAGLAAGAAHPHYAAAALADIESARVALAVRQVTAGVRMADLALGATLLACRGTVERLAAPPEAPQAPDAARVLALTCLAPLSAATAGLPPAGG